jgi:hypothetical protein
MQKILRKKGWVWWLVVLMYAIPMSGPPLSPWQESEPTNKQRNKIKFFLHFLLITMSNLSLTVMSYLHAAFSALQALLCQ